MPGEKKKLGDLLIEAQLVSPQDVRAALVQQRQWGGRLGSILVSSGYLTEDQLLSFLREHFNLPSINLNTTSITNECLAKVPEKVAKQYKLIPVEVKKIQGKDCLIVAMTDPTNVQAIDEVSFLCGLPIQPAVAPDAVIDQAIKHYYDKTESFLDAAGIPYDHLDVTYLPSTPAVGPPSTPPGFRIEAKVSAKSPKVQEGSQSLTQAQAKVSAKSPEVQEGSQSPTQAQAKVSASSSDTQAGSGSPSEIQQLRTEVRAIANLLIANGFMDQEQWDDAIKS